ncbi:response regulator [Piscirickettsia litoralis]|uniref:Response regulatory domain-containing protein n=1 Tax=Piscirickettsia litoralis TaxID=1891921 RepID=A0ABX3A3H1_9GAMM|nr:response regulator [Piscirickettsia litoralis]ODN42188.1 hypothetical protein BGC07_03585 [Piscirickettsia litoralis]
MDILLAEDDLADQNLIKLACAKSKGQHELHIVEDGEQALQYLRRQGSFSQVQTPDLIILDINMPKLSGLEVLDQLAQEPKLKQIPIIILTTSDLEQDQNHSYTEGAKSFITKPASFDEYITLFDRFDEDWFRIVCQRQNSTQSKTTNVIPFTRKN